MAALCASAGGGYWMARWRRPDEDKTVQKNPREKKGATPEKTNPKPNPFEALPMSLGDVVVADREERWLAGGVVAKEGSRVVAAVFFAPEGAALKTVVAFAEPRREVFWLAPAEADSPSEPPAAIEIGNVPMTRKARFPVTLSKHGQGVPSFGETGIFAEYEGGADEVAVLLTSSGRARAWSGRRLAEGQYDRLGSGGDGS